VCPPPPFHPPCQFFSLAIGGSASVFFLGSSSLCEFSETRFSSIAPLPFAPFKETRPSVGKVFLHPMPCKVRRMGQDPWVFPSHIAPSDGFSAPHGGVQPPLPFVPACAFSVQCSKTGGRSFGGPLNQRIPLRYLTFSPSFVSSFSPPPPDPPTTKQVPRRGRFLDMPHLGFFLPFSQSEAGGPILFGILTCFSPRLPIPIPSQVERK